MPINVFHINTLDNKGGAAKSTYRLSAALRASSGFPSYMIVGAKLTNSHNVFQLPRGFVRRLAKGRDNWLSLFLPGYFGVRKIAGTRVLDVVHFHNMHGGYFKLSGIIRLVRKYHAVWTLHDPWIIYEYGGVPEYDEIFTKKRISWVYRQLKKRIIPKVVGKVTFTAPSLWLKEKVLEVFPEADVRHIPNFIDTNIFRPTDQSKARKQLGLDSEKFYVMLVADDGEDNKSKGADALDRICQKSNGKIAKLIIGGKDNYVSDEHQMALYYSAADLFVFPTRADNFPLVTLESMACGTPAVAYAVGGVPEQINHMEDGCLVEPGDEVELARCVATLASDPEKMKKMSKEAAKKVNKLYNEDSVVKQYIDLYKEINGHT